MSEIKVKLSHIFERNELCEKLLVAVWYDKHGK